jgi:purine nucleosidase/ribosylpyrimidine nucleosidase
MPRRVVLDCDTGTDDAVAVMLAALHPDLELLGVVATWGNASVDVTRENTRRVLAHVGRADVPVLAGLAGPVSDHPAPPDASRPGSEPPLSLPPSPAPRHDGPAVDWLVETAHATAEPLTVVATGPLSSLAAALDADPRVRAAVTELVVMGGGHAVGTVTASAERNFWHDPVAARRVLTAGLERLVLVTADATTSAAFTSSDADRLERLGTPAGAAAATFLRLRLRARPDQEAAALHDPLAVAYLLDPDVVRLRPFHVDVETRGEPTYGRSVMDVQGLGGRPANALVALTADRDRFLAVLERTLGVEQA